MQQVDIVVPVFNEQGVLAASIRRLHDTLSTGFPFSWRIVIADNASTDGTPVVARDLAADLEGVEYLRLECKGRGRALRAAWSASEAHVVAYMDVDLSTDLRALLPLVAPLVSGHSDVSIGTRLSPSAQIVRGTKREVISQSYNRILKTILGVRFSDAQCGFKAVRRDAAAQLLPEIKDENWFFDTELLVLAQRQGMRIHEVPVDWVDDPDSRVDIVRTAVEDLKGVARLLTSTSVFRFLCVGVASTLAYALLFLGLAGPLGAAWANLAALAVTGVANTQVNRAFTFRIRGREGLPRQHAQGLAVFVLTLGLTSGALAVLHGIDSEPARAVQVGVLVVASLFATITRFVALRSWIFARQRRPGALRAAARALTAKAGN